MWCEINRMGKRPGCSRGRGEKMLAHPDFRREHPCSGAHQNTMALDLDQLEKPIRKLRKLLKKMPSEPTPKQVHDLSTNARRLEAMLEAIDPDQNGRRILKQIAKVRKKAGKVRDMDVLTAFAAGLSPDGDEEACAVRLLEHLGAVRRSNAK